MTERRKTRLISCPTCGLRTHHEWQVWEKWTLLSRLIGRKRPIVMGGWVCTTCGHRADVQRLDAEQEPEQS
jgi:C4-type Zn-finger protein